MCDCWQPAASRLVYYLSPLQPKIAVYQCKLSMAVTRISHGNSVVLPFHDAAEQRNYTKTDMGKATSKSRSSARRSWAAMAMAPGASLHAGLRYVQGRRCYDRVDARRHNTRLSHLPLNFSRTRVNHSNLAASGSQWVASLRQDVDCQLAWTAWCISQLM